MAFRPDFAGPGVCRLGQRIRPGDQCLGNPGWVDSTREETYHLLCADPRGNLPKALASAVKAAEHSPIRARQWAALIADAGRDITTLAQALGETPYKGIQGDDCPLSHLTDNDASLDRTIACRRP